MPAQRGRVDEERRLHLDVSVLAGVQIEHEVDERARHPGAHPHQHREPGAAHARRALEVDDAERGADLPMRPRIEVERRRLAVPAHELIVLCRPADRHAGVRQVRQRQQQCRALVLGLIELDLELADLLRTRLARGKERSRVLALPLGTRDLVAGACSARA